ncbi:MAG TPA: aspartate kinase, partial [Rhizomicrobium sp.]|nr:aspartate kinase [Rhizomicrobium sp.]
MATIAMKFGGTSVADIERIRHVASLVKREVERGNKVAVVVSAMAGETNKLVAWTNDAAKPEGASLASTPDRREYDVVVAAGEQVTCGLLAIALNATGVKARSWLGWQVPINTSAMHGAARIEGVPASEMKKAIEGGEVAVVAGFQGVAPGTRISTLGRGGSDTSAVAVAAGIGAERCDIYTDVDGVYTTDPRIVPKARRLEKIAYEEMLEMASLGAKVLQTRSVEIAMLHRVPTRVLSTFTPDVGGTLLCDEEDIVEKKPVTGIAYSRDEAKITLHKVPDKPGVAIAIFGPLADAGVNVDMIVQNVSEDGKTTDLTFTCTRGELNRALQAIETHGKEIGYR